MRSAAPDGYSSVSPYLLVDSVEKELEFLVAIFQAEIKEQRRDDEGAVWHAEARVGDTTVILGRAPQEYSSIQSMLYVWTDDVDAAYLLALERGGTSVSEPSDRPDGKREAGIQDPQGNTWWVAQKSRKLSSKEVERRLAEQRRKRL